MSFFLGSFCAASWQTNGPVRTAYAARSNNDCPFGQCSFKRGSARGLRVQPSATRGGTAGRMRSAASTSVILRSFSGSNSFPGWSCYDWAFYPPPYYGFGPLPPVAADGDRRAINAVKEGRSEERPHHLSVAAALQSCGKG